MQDTDKKQARELLIKAKVYRILAGIFAVVGVLIFLMLYFNYYGDDVAASIKDPMLIFLLLFPFLPAVILSLKAKKADKALSKLLTPGT